MHTCTRREDRRKTQLESVFCYCFIICSVLEFLGPDNGTTPRYSFCLWVQPTNTNVKIIPLQTGLKYIHTQSQSLSQAPRTKTRARTLTSSLSHTHENSLTIEYILRRKTKQNSQLQSLEHFIFVHTRMEQRPPQTGSGHTLPCLCGSCLKPDTILRRDAFILF